jgi:hypothetical protein
MRPPSELTRLPRSLTLRKYYKGNEFETWLLYYSLIVLDGILPDEYYRHWFLFVFASHLLTQDSISRNEITLADNILRDFVQKTPELYSIECCTFNLHTLSHVGQAVRDWGSIHKFSCFNFENTIGECVALVKGSNAVALQISRKFLMRRLLPNLSDRMFGNCDLRTAELMKKLSCSGHFIRKKDLQTDGVHLYGASTDRTLNNDEYNAARRFLGYNLRLDRTMRFYRSFSVSGIYVTCMDHRETRRNDKCIKLLDETLALVLACVVSSFCVCAGACECLERVLIFVKPLRNAARSVCRNNKHGINANTFIKSMTNADENFRFVRPMGISKKSFMCETEDNNVIVIPLESKPSD